MEVAISSLWKSRYKDGNAELGWIIFFDAQIKQYAWNRDWINSKKTFINIKKTVHQWSAGFPLRLPEVLAWLATDF